MKLAFMMVTRGNPKRAAAIMECAQSLSSGRHEIQFIVGCDNDDPETSSYFHKHYKTRVSVADRPTGVGAVWNRCASLIDADYYCPFPDDVWPILPDWDDLIASTLAPATPQLAALAWNDQTNHGQCTLPIVSREWIALTGKFYDERFPFWFYDTCIDELYSFITGQRIVIPDELALVSKKGLTQNLRELPFWWDLYVATRDERLNQASDIRKQLGIELPTQRLDRIVEMWERRDEIGRATAAAIEKTLSAERRAPSPQYLQAREHAAAYLAEVNR